jgi:hypothetical protein
MSLQVAVPLKWSVSHSLSVHGPDLHLSSVSRRHDLLGNRSLAVSEFEVCRTAFLIRLSTSLPRAGLLSEILKQKFHLGCPFSWRPRCHSKEVNDHFGEEQSIELVVGPGQLSNATEQIPTARYMSRVTRA